MRNAVLIFLAWLSSASWAEYGTFPGYVQALLGQLQLDDDNVTVNRGDLDLEGSLDDLPYGGGAVQMPFKDDVIGYGWEAGAFISWENDEVSYFARSGGNGATVRIGIDNAFWSVETFMGMYGALKPLDWLRFYVGAGPLLMFAGAESDDIDEEVDIDGSIETIVEDGKSDQDVSLGWYARAGAEVRIGKQTWVGVNLRHMDVEVDLAEAIGEFDIDGELYLLSITRRF